MLLFNTDLVAQVSQVAQVAQVARVVRVARVAQVVRVAQAVLQTALPVFLVVDFENLYQ